MLGEKYGSLIVFLLIFYGVAFTAAFVTRPQIATWYALIAKPSWRPPNWLFGPVWSVLYGMMAMAGWRIWCAGPSAARTLAMTLLSVQLALNFVWSPIFFHLHRMGLSVLILGTLCVLLFALIGLTWSFERTASYLFLPYLFWVGFAAALNFSIWRLNPQVPSLSSSTVFANPVASAGGIGEAREEGVATAVRFTGTLDAAGFPDDAAWHAAPVMHFNTDWQGRNADDGRATEVRLLWTPETLYLLFYANYRNVTVFLDAEPNGHRDLLWDRDVAEVFLQPDSSDPLRYKEFEVSPNGFWIDLDISHGERQELRSGLRRRVHIDATKNIWVAWLEIPMKSLTPHFDSKAVWHVNFYRVEGASEPRFYSAWRPTRTPEPNFHVPAAFGRLVFESTTARRP